MRTVLALVAFMAACGGEDSSSGPPDAAIFHGVCLYTDVECTRYEACDPVSGGCLTFWQDSPVCAQCPSSPCGACLDVNECAERIEGFEPWNPFNGTPSPRSVGCPP